MFQHLRRRVAQKKTGEEMDSISRIAVRAASHVQRAMQGAEHA